MTAPDPRVGEIQAIPAEAVEAAARVMLDKLYSDKTLKVDDEDRDIVRDILNAAHPVLLAELRKAHEALARVEAHHKRVEGYQFGAIPGAEPDWPVCSTCFTEDEHPQPWPCPTAAAVAAANGENS